RAAWAAGPAPRPARWPFRGWPRRRSASALRWRGRACGPVPFRPPCPRAAPPRFPVVPGPRRRGFSFMVVDSPRRGQRFLSDNGGMGEADTDAVGALADPVRRRLYEYVAGREGETSRAEAAGAVGVRRTLAAFHLDKLVEAGLLTTSRRKLSGREGPGSGRPAKLYRRADRQVNVHLPPRDYETAAHLLAEAVQHSGVEESLHAAARAEGRRRGRAAAVERPVDADGLCEVLTRLGYEPAADEEE